ncbi:ATP-dependent DNA helicase PIF1-like [Paramacrobiotus metropolitanus]|uniref:ATP-dependent DNA helicase PIF1-like n=1 Tax=Paramacrobiotus metropolitanus TaxID=2943436 RepID=UPI0024459D11|nr:ATP-dependent DNA helicase PIF1-like [Paramacrobiotus metropolitanus]
MLTLPFSTTEINELYNLKGTDDEFLKAFEAVIPEVLSSAEWLPETYKSMIRAEVELAGSKEYLRNMRVQNTLYKGKDGCAIAAGINNSENNETGCSFIVENVDKTCFTAEQLAVYETVESYLHRWLQHRRKVANGEKCDDLEPFRIFVQGSAGCGKTYLIKSIIKLVRNFCIAEKGIVSTARYHGGCLVAAPTGCAAHNIGGSTLHDLFGLDVQDGAFQGYRVSTGQKLNNLRGKLNGAIMLIVDEISMVGRKLFYQVSQRLNEVKDTVQKKGSFFGNLPVILFGDLFQLRPVQAKFIFENCGELVDLWKLFSPVFFKINMRQLSDDGFREGLESLRKGLLTVEFDKLLRSRCLNPSVNPDGYVDVKREYEERFKDTIHLFYRVKCTQKFNFTSLVQLAKSASTPVFEIKATDTEDLDHIKRKSVKKALKPSKDAKSTGGLNEHLHVAKGCRVMLTQNIDVNSGLVNGARGTLLEMLWFREETGTDETTPEIHDCLYPDCCRPDTVRVKMPSRMKILFDGNTEPSIILPVTSYFFDLNKVAMRRTQFPVILSYAMTIHKSQGATILTGSIDLNFGKCRPQGGFYVALSRFPSASAFVLLDYTPESFAFSKSALTEIQRLEAYGIQSTT